MGSIPHGNALLAGGSATPFSGSPTIGAPTGGGNPAFSLFPSFNSSPFTVAPPIIIRAAGTSEFASIAAGGFTQYTLTNAASATNPRTPFGNTPPIPLPSNIYGVPMQDVVNDPISFYSRLSQNRLLRETHLKGRCLTSRPPRQSNLRQRRRHPPQRLQAPTRHSVRTVTVSVADAAGGAENLPFLVTNAETTLVYATFGSRRSRQRVAGNSCSFNTRRWSCCSSRQMGYHRQLPACFRQWKVEFLLAPCFRRNAA